MTRDLVNVLVERRAERVSQVLHLFGGPFATDPAGRRLDVPEGSKRLLVFVALHRGRVERRHAAGTLWPIGDDGRAAGNLRSALWRLNRAKIDFVVADKQGLALRDDVLIDVHLVDDWASEIISVSGAQDEGARRLESLPRGVEALELLPGWYDDWVLMERERIRQRVLHALESLSRQLAAAGRHGEAVDAAMLAVSAEPLRESAQRALVEAHLAEGNWVEGRRSFEFYRDVLWRELGVCPDPAFARLLGPCAAAPVAERPAADRSRRVPAQVPSRAAEC